ncbi:two pore domain potassium channel family protein [Granulicella sp. 5B5]|uniref:potassium channel family protein n=1 Tax=Granulicella sp. 5B5 TaxID=1617967 RepID=UPI0015F35B4B|nr:potassium channel family protein [Granulicella sp. 5B5]QMV19220.1 two pore domain potassium channel family protein [Granulicella sp. 5B5]
MHIVAALFGCLFLGSVLLDAFQTIILPRRPVGRFRLTRLFLLATWEPWLFLARINPSRRVREQLYSIYGPLALLVLFVVWAALLTSAYALIYFGLHMPFTDPAHPLTLWQRLRTCLYVSGSSIFTLGLGDVIPTTQLARFLLVAEAGTGLGFIALVIGYVPVLYNAFSTREVPVAMLDARAGSPPTAGELLLRHNFSGGHEALTTLLAEWERWCAEMLETHISYPILCYYRSQHDNQSWLAALTAILDTCALVITTVEGPSTRQAQLTFAVGRHVLVDLGHVFRRESVEQRLRTEPPTRLPDEEFVRLADLLCAAGYSMCSDLDVRERLFAIRRLYEPHAESMAEYLRLTLPNWAPPVRDPSKKPDGWKTVEGLRYSAAIADRLVSQISRQSTAVRLHDDSSHPF